MALASLAGCASLYRRPAPPLELGVREAQATELGALPNLRLGRLEVEDWLRGGGVLRFGRGELFGGPGDSGDRLSGQVVTRFRLEDDGAPAWSVACRVAFPEDEDAGGQAVEHVCRFEPEGEGRPPLRLVLASPAAASLSGAFVRGDRVVAELEGTSALPRSRRWPRTTGVTLRRAGGQAPLAFVTTTQQRDAVWFAPGVSETSRALLAPAILALAAAADPRNEMEGQSWVEREPGGGIDATHIPPFDPAPSRSGAATRASTGETPSLEDAAVGALGAAGHDVLARALARAEASQESWLDRPRAPAPLVGPDLREGRHDAFLLVDALIALSASQPLGVEGSPSFGWFLAAGVDLWDFVDLYGFLELMPRHPLGEDAPLERRPVGRFGYGGRLNLVRVDDVRVFGGFEHGFSLGAATLVEAGAERARWRGEALGPTAGFRVRLGETLEGRAADLRVEGVLHRERWRLESGRLGAGADRDRWAPTLRTVLQLKI